MKNPPQPDAAPSPRTSRWYETAFGEDYSARYAHRDHDEARRAARLVLDRVPLGPDPRVFDLCCGAGRHVAVFDEAGIRAFGGDRSEALLRQAGPARFPLVRLDMRHLPFREGAFDLVTNFFTAFGYFEQDDENLAVFGEVARVLRPGGWFFLDFLNRETTIRQIESLPAEEIQRMPDGSAWQIQRRLTPGNRRAEKSQRRVPDAGGTSAIFESVRLFSPEELRNGLAGAGLRPVHEFGDYTGSAFDEDRSGRFILVCERL